MTSDAKHFWQHCTMSQGDKTAHAFLWVILEITVLAPGLSIQILLHPSLEQFGLLLSCIAKVGRAVAPSP